MKDEISKSTRLGLTLAGGALLTALPFGLTVNASGAPSVAFRDACASTTTNVAVDGSCKPYLGWVCGLNGQNYNNMKYVPPGC
ncbi:MAG TPA: hypothetical protein VN803_07345 [Gemmatimonadales bacterium]|nr:hypothetical protein [Gemmatimonadales bacterium]